MYIYWKLLIFKEENYKQYKTLYIRLYRIVKASSKVKLYELTD